MLIDFKLAPTVRRTGSTRDELEQYPYSPQGGESLREELRGPSDKEGNVPVILMQQLICSGSLVHCQNRRTSSGFLMGIMR